MADTFSKADGRLSPGSLVLDGDNWYVAGADGFVHKLRVQAIDHPVELDVRTYSWVDGTPLRIGQFLQDINRATWIIVALQPPRIYLYAEKGEKVAHNLQRGWAVLMQQMEDSVGPLSRLDRRVVSSFG